jgi:hypothetical protein
MRATNTLIYNSTTNFFPGAWNFALFVKLNHVLDPASVLQWGWGDPPVSKKKKKITADG